MPKQKTHSGAGKRFSLTATGKVRRSKSGKGHILTKKTRKRKRNLRKSTVVSPVEAKRIRKLLAS